MTQENRLREKIEEILEYFHYNCSDRECERLHNRNALKETIDAILSAVWESLPKKKTIRSYKTPEMAGIHIVEDDGWNAYRTEVLKLLGAKDDGE